MASKYTKYTEVWEILLEVWQRSWLLHSAMIGIAGLTVYGSVTEGFSAELAAVGCLAVSTSAATLLSDVRQIHIELLQEMVDLLRDED